MARKKGHSYYNGVKIRKVDLPNPFLVGLRIYRFLKNLDEQKRREIEWEETEKERILIQEERIARKIEREERLRNINDRIAEVNKLNVEIKARLDNISYLLSDSLSKDHSIDYESEIDSTHFEVFKIPEELTRIKEPPKLEDYLKKIQKPFFVVEWLNIEYFLNIHKEKISEAKRKFTLALDNYRESENRNSLLLERFKTEFEKRKTEFEIEKKKKNDELSLFLYSLKKGKKESVLSHYCKVLENSIFPESVQFEYTIDYDSAKKCLKFLLYVQSIDIIIPKVIQYKYIKSRDEITEKKFKFREILELYALYLSNLSLRLIYESFSADEFNILKEVKIECKAEILDKSVGTLKSKTISKFTLSKKDFSTLNLSQVNPILTFEKFNGKFFFDEF